MYVKMMQNKQFIESHLLDGLENSLNAEIAAGTISTLQEGVQWLKQTYFYQRMAQMPAHYGIKPQDLLNDPTGNFHIFENIIHEAALGLFRK